MDPRLDKNKDIPALLSWLLYGQRGRSSETIAAVLGGVYDPQAGEDHDIPHDIWDFGRCHDLLEAVPSFYTRLYELADVMPRWRPLAYQWRTLRRLYLEAKANNFADVDAFGAVLKGLETRGRAYEAGTVMYEGEWSIDIQARTMVHESTGLAMRVERQKGRWDACLESQEVRFEGQGLPLRQFAKIAKDGQRALERVLQRLAEQGIDFPASRESAAAEGAGLAHG